MTKQENTPNQPQVPPAAHRTISVFEVHTIGRDRQPITHWVTQKIVALKPLTKVPYYFETDGVQKVQGHAGCYRGDQRKLEGTAFSVADLILFRPLNTGQEATISYRTWFEYDMPPPPEYKRRIGSSALPELSITVQFDKNHLPRSVWEGQWPDASPDTLPTSSSLVTPQSELSTRAGYVAVHRQEIDVQPGAVIGHHWQW